jgi:16S rRNA (adenine1518-N6/adenine1519-N6)-dimethyltransferase
VSSDARGESAAGVLARLRAAGLSPRKQLGQHFLHDPRLLSAIVSAAGVEAGDRVLEVGTGPGTLTREIARRAAEVVTVEVDPAMVAFARSELRGFENIRFVEANALDGKGRLAPELERIAASIEPFLWVSNLPYGLAATLIVLLCESSLRWTRGALTVQDEVARRIAAGPGDAEYGPTSALVAYRASARLGKRIAPGAFWPPPEVTSRVLHLERKNPLGPPDLYAAYRAWVKRLFATRRKQIGGMLREALGDDAAARAMAQGGWKPSMRPDSLAPRDFLLLAERYPPDGGAFFTLTCPEAHP